MGFFDDILIPPESLQQPAKLYPDQNIPVDNNKSAVISYQQFCIAYELCSDRDCWGVLSYSLSDEAEQVWLWEYETDEGAHDLYMDQGEEIRFRVTDEVFVDTSPTGPAAAATDTPAQPGQSTAPPAEGSVEKKEPPYTLIVSQYSVTHTRTATGHLPTCFSWNVRPWSGRSTSPSISVVTGL